MVARYDKLKTPFVYPDNWQIVDEQLTGTPQGVSVQSPDGAYWDLKIFSLEDNPDAVCERALEAMREVYENLECEAVREKLFDVPAVGYNLDFFCMDFLVTAELRSFTLGDHTVLLTCQGESREFGRQRAVFAAITKSLLSET
jgi:hypothetical protein